MGINRLGNRLFTTQALRPQRNTEVFGRSPFSVYRLPFPVSRSPFPVPRFPFTVFRLPFSVHRFPFTVSRSPFSVHRFPFTANSQSIKCYWFRKDILYLRHNQTIINMQSLEDKILEKIKKAKRGSLFFTEDFLRFGTAKAVAKALERLVERGAVERIARGIYARIHIDPILGPVKPGTEEIAKAISKRDKARIIPTGRMAMSALGLSTQVPVNAVYLTDGAARHINLGKRKIVFKKAAPKNLSAIGAISSLVIQALKEIGKGKATDEELGIILKQLQKEEPHRLEHDIRLAPEWIRVIMRKALKSNE